MGGGEGSNASPTTLTLFPMQLIHGFSFKDDVTVIPFIGFSFLNASIKFRTDAEMVA
jgi:hypothetical protein